MRRNLLWVLAALVVAAMVAKIGVAFSAELLSNGGFESGTTGWTASGATFEIVTSPVRSGSQAASVTNASTTLYGIYQLVTGITGDTTYYLSGYGYRNNSNINGVLLRIHWYSEPDGGGSYIGYDDSNSLTTDSTSWQLMSTGVITAPGTAQSARVRAYVDSKTGGTSVTAYFDDLSLSDSPTAVTLSSLTAHSPTSQATFFRWQWLALTGAVGLVFGGVAVARRLFRQ